MIIVDTYTVAIYRSQIIWSCSRGLHDIAANAARDHGVVKTENVESFVPVAVTVY